MAMQSSGPGGAMSEINVTPLVDVMLVLLIIFMVTTAATEQQKLEAQTQASLQEQTESLVELNLPVTLDNPLLADPETSKLVMVIDRNLRVFLVRGLTGEGGERALTDCSQLAGATSVAQWTPCFDDVKAKLGGARETANRRMIEDGVYLQADADAPYGFVSGVMDRLRELGVTQINFVTDPSGP